MSDVISLYREKKNISDISIGKVFKSASGMNLSDIKDTLDYKPKYDKLSRRLKKNKLVAYYYDLFAEDVRFDDLPFDIANSEYFNSRFWSYRIDDIHKRSERICSCASYWSGDYYRLQGIKDIKKVNLCRDRFCDNCQNTLSVQRSDKYEPLLMKLAEDYSIYHVILTVPNVYPKELSQTLDKMTSSYKRLCQYLDGRKRIHNVNYTVSGYLGSIRALEITKNKEKGTFHPHFHCLWICKKGTKICNERSHVNYYSFKENNPHISSKNYSTNEPQRFFSDFEILIQKTWRLLYDGKEVNYSNLDELKIGYSCMIANAMGRYKEVFKYATKGLLSSSEDKSPTDNYTDFVFLFVALFRRRLIQGYGCLYHLTFDDKIDLLSTDDLYIKVLQDLHTIETPVSYYETLKEFSENIENEYSPFRYISRKSVARLGADDT